METMHADSGEYGMVTSESDQLAKYIRHMDSPGSDHGAVPQDPLLLVAEQVPEFGGAYIDGDTLVIRLTQESDAAPERSRRALSDLCGRRLR